MTHPDAMSCVCTSPRARRAIGAVAAAMALVLTTAAFFTPPPVPAAIALLLLGGTVVVMVQYRMRKALVASEQRQRLTLEGTNAAIWDWNIPADDIYHSPRWARMLGFERPSEHTIGFAAWRDRIHPEDRPRIEQTLNEHLEGATDTWDVEYRIRTESGDFIWLHTRGKVVRRDPRGRPSRMTGTHIDISRRKQTEQALRESQQRYALVLEGTNDGLWDYDLTTGRVHYSIRFKAMFGLDEADMGDTIDDFLTRVHPDDRKTLRSRLGTHLPGFSRGFEQELRGRHRNGDDRWMLCRATIYINERGEPCRVAGSITDIHDRKLAEQRLQHEAEHDALTGLPNRARFQKLLDRAISRARNHAEQRFAVLFLDFDGFKRINDGLGHEAGDQLLIQIAGRLTDLVVSADGASECDNAVARLGGDEFTILLGRIEDTAQVVAMARALQARLSEPCDIAGHHIRTTASIGIVIGDGTRDTPADLLRDADTAMYRAKGEGKARFAIFDQQMHEQVRFALELENDLREAARRGEMVLYYQPIVTMATAKPAGFEVLLRWQHPRYGLLEPARFMGIAEETGSILSIGRWVIDHACAQLGRWRAEGIMPPASMLSVNISRRQLLDPGLADAVAEALQRHGVPAGQLKLEITETVMSEHLQASAETLDALCRLGVELMLDDFGTGQSSLHQLHKLPVSTLKIDRVFIADMADMFESSAMIQAIVTLAHNMNLKVIAEGVERADQLAALLALECDYAQGYYFSRPMPAAEAERFARAQSPALSPVA